MTFVSLLKPVHDEDQPALVLEIGGCKAGAPQQSKPFTAAPLTLASGV